MPPLPGNLSLSLWATLPARGFCVVFPDPQARLGPGICLYRGACGALLGPPFLAASLPALIIPFQISASRPLHRTRMVLFKVTNNGSAQRSFLVVAKVACTFGQPPFDQTTLGTTLRQCCSVSQAAASVFLLVSSPEI